MFGLIGGLGVGAAIFYYENLAKRYVQRNRPLPLLMVHADMQTVVGHVTNGESRALAEYFRKLLQHLADGGATHAAIPAVTPHLCLPDLLPVSPLPLVSIGQGAREDVRSRGIRRVALFGTRFTIQNDMFGLLDAETEIVRPSVEEVSQIHEIYYRIAVDGRPSPGHYESLTELAHRLIDRERLDAIVLAGTELALLFDEANVSFPAVDCARLHLDAIVQANDERAA